MAAGFIITGDKLLAARLARLGATAPLALGGALYAEAEGIMGVSRGLAPVDTGVLRGSGVVRQPRISGDGAEVEFGYGGAASAYAVIQHERVDFSHQVGQAKYLEQPVLAAASGMDGRLAAGIRPWLYA